jgi:hypothetical protein
LPAWAIAAIRDLHHDVNPRIGGDPPPREFGRDLSGFGIEDDLLHGGIPSAAVECNAPADYGDRTRGRRSRDKEAKSTSWTRFLRLNGQAVK